ncbi:hypothetical protein FHS43_003085 [Streptosporangium becharense]|uniref:Uncharacterized protein n=1 Tax=Streptosporangium becharense TaxID=1816182 RepID=A0A7W9MIU8_9ACTN|nr:VLRF1 family aeRF1-type release factor [Streptosporangium becharense]MBB2911812.1 hypothetical protein [Streptosporangium becharense]MBB5822370.1 hypothetical protein [Streptosporangium becharense]
MEFDRAALRDVVSIRDDLGVLSFYLMANPREDASSRPAWRIRFRNEVTALRDRIAADPDRSRRKAILKRLEGLEPYFPDLLNPAESGPGRVMFAPVGSEEVWTFTFQLPLPDHVTLDRTACVRPLVNAVEAAPPAGVAAVSKDGLRVVDYRYGLAREVGTTRFETGAEGLGQTRGPGQHAEASSQGAWHRDKVASRIDEGLARQVRGAAPRLAEHVESRGWTALVLTGDVQLTEILAAELGGEVIQVDAMVDSQSPTKIVEYVEPQLAAARTRRGVGLADRARDLALSGGRGALGLADTLAALNESRVANVLLAESYEWSGRRDGDGLLYADGQSPPAGSGRELTPEPVMGERMIERALDTDAEVTVLTGEAADALADFDGVAALLRW